ncbi:endonuclease III [Rhabdochlamydiaceae symbiont of Dictyostelium giganteum]|uniref:endonuclease III n=1 Tax=Rhabdochlamydiaceae symbiont of Dictyostelium giganteum TaxID=3342349 RepID=UPI00384E40C2
MKKTAKDIQVILEHYFPDPKPPLTHFDPYTLLIAVVLSARNTDAKVNQVTPHLFKKAKTPEEMVRLTVEEIRDIIRPCGLSPTKAKNIWKLSQILLEEYEGEVPQSFEALESLPGVGHKTASVVMAQAFHIPAFPVDTHIIRSAKRWGLSSAKTAEKIEMDLKKIFLKKDWIKLHLQIIYFAREFCPARGHHVNCPICHLSEIPMGSPNLPDISIP